MHQPPTQQALQLWGGPECTVNRVGDGGCDQIRLSGHHHRPDDLERFASLGLTAIRYPLLWERIAPDPARPPDWRWSDERLARLRALGLRPIAGLVHHGSGPRHLHLLHDDFAPGLGRFAGQVAARYPWIADWTPVNEPLTTARFSALYGHWYPHARDEGAFWRALVNQVDGTRAAMRAIRRVNPAARLIQTDDLGRTYATLPLAAQAGFDNLRRWAGWDLLFGRVTPHHPLWHRLAHHGLADRLRAIADDPCPPDVVGVNHYLTSDRFIDHRLQLYPRHVHGGNGRRAYADTEAVRVLDPPPPGLAGALREAWARYRVPVAATEVHLGCTREEQLRWAAEAWDTATALRTDGVDVTAVTAWALLGSHGWDTLLTTPGRYETGVFDVGAGTPRPTALAPLWRGLPSGTPRHPVACEAGWWRRPERLLHRPLARPAAAPAGPDTDDGGARELVILGRGGMVATAFARACVARGIRHRLVGRTTIDLDRPGLIPAALDRLRPWAVVNAAGWSRIDAAEADPAACHRTNADGATALARAAADRQLPCLTLSTDQVFDGTASRPYRERDPVAPPGAYGRSKAAMEAGCAGLPGSLVIRTAALFVPHAPTGFAAAVRAALAMGHPFAAAADVVVSPTPAAALADVALDLLIDGADGIWHVAGAEALSWAAFARRIAGASGLDPALIRPVAARSLRRAAARPAYAALESERGVPAIALDPHLQAFARIGPSARAA